MKQQDQSYSNRPHHEFILRDAHLLPIISQVWEKVQWQFCSEFWEPAGKTQAGN